MNLVLHLWKDEAGQDLTEYALLLTLISLVVIASLGKLATAIRTAVNTAANDLAVST